MTLSPEWQMFFNAILVICGFLGGWVLNNLKSSIDLLHIADNDLTTKVQAIEVLVAGTYVRRDDMVKLGTALFQKLDRIELKLDGKVDK